MVKLLVRDLAPETLERLNKRTREVAEVWQQRLAGRVLSDSTDLLREDRER